MTVAELITILSGFNPAAEVGTWSSYQNGHPMDDPANMTQIASVGTFSDPDVPPMETKEVTFFLSLGIVEEDLA